MNERDRIVGPVSVAAIAPETIPIRNVAVQREVRSHKRAPRAAKQQ